jgi:Predicted integral membrane protein
MWTRETLKSYAKNELASSYWLSFAICLVGSILGNENGGFQFNFSFNIGNRNTEIGRQITQIVSRPFIFYTGLYIGIIVFILAMCFFLFIAGPITVGNSSFFIRAPRGDRKFSNLFSAFQNEYYLRTVKTIFIMQLKIFLWSLLLIIPGIIAAYRYSMIPYLISDDPSLTTQQAFQISKEMTDGEKADIWVLDLSFIGWYLLGLLACGIGVLFVNPYYQATKAQLYYALCAKIGMYRPSMNTEE